MGGNGWDEWRNHVLEELRQQRASQERLFERLDTMSQDIAALKVKSGLWGMIGGAFSICIAIGIYVIKCLVGMGQQP